MWGRICAMANARIASSQTGYVECVLKEKRSIPKMFEAISVQSLQFAEA